MKKYYYVCPRCGHRWSFFLKRKEIHCEFCGQDWDPSESRYKKLHGSYFSWSAFGMAAVGVCVVIYGGVRLADALGYDATNKIMTLLGRPPVEKTAEDDARSLEERIAERRALYGEDELEPVDDLGDRESSEEPSSNVASVPESVPVGRVRERKPAGDQTLDRAVQEANAESDGATNSDNDWDF